MLAKGNESRFQNWQLQDAILFYTFTPNNKQRHLAGGFGRTESNCCAPNHEGLPVKAITTCLRLVG